MKLHLVAYTVAHVLFEELLDPWVTKICTTIFQELISMVDSRVCKDKAVLRFLSYSLEVTNQQLLFRLDPRKVAECLNSLSISRLLRCGPTTVIVEFFILS